jgi:hypothetical protein
MIKKVVNKSKNNKSKKNLFILFSQNQVITVTSKLETSLKLFKISASEN